MLDRANHLFFALLFGAVACGGTVSRQDDPDGPGDSGGMTNPCSGAVIESQCVMASSKLVDLTDAEITAICSELVPAQKECPDGVTVTRNGPEECVPSVKNIPETCAATVGDFRSCNEADLCDVFTNEGCMKLFECASSPP